MSNTGRVAVLVALVSVILAITHLRTRPSSDFGGHPWTATVTKGTVLWDVRGTGKLIRTGPAGKLAARIIVPDSIACDLQRNQKAEVDIQNTSVKGHVSYVNRSTSDGIRTVDIAFSSPLPAGPSANQRVEADIHLGKLDDILYVGRPIHADQNSSIPVFRVVGDGKQAVRTMVRFGRASVNTIEILDGLKEGDEIILSDMSAWNSSETVSIR